jgi:hypothetical protein
MAPFITNPYRFVDLETEFASMYASFTNHYNPIVTTDGSYTVLKFTQSGTFTPTSSFNVEYLVVGGGGGSSAGAGGAGAFRTNGAIDFQVTAQAYPITIGHGGGRSSASGSIVGGNGGDSIFSTITSTGGGGGAKVNNNGVAGGSGGAGAPKSSGTTTGGAGGTGGYAGGGNGGYTASPYQSGGGGGASQVGFDASSATQSGAGGAGLASSITGTSTYYAGGGGGSAWQGTGAALGGVGGGGAGSANAGYSAGGTPNTGGGAGAGNSTNAVYNGTSDGGSGIVVLRFLTSGNTYNTDVDTIANKQHFVEWFSGKTINTDRWTSQDVTGSGSIGMVDAVDGGAYVASASGVNEHQTMNFDGICQYSPSASVIIGVTTSHPDGMDEMSGFSSGNNSLDSANHLALYTRMNNNTYRSLSTSDGAGGTINQTNTSITYASGISNYSVWKVENNGSACTLDISGVEEATTTTKTPTAKMQPSIAVRSKGSFVAYTNVRYLEAYNT